LLYSAARAASGLEDSLDTASLLAGIRTEPAIAAAMCAQRTRTVYGCHKRRLAQDGGMAGQAAVRL